MSMLPEHVGKHLLTELTIWPTHAHLHTQEYRWQQRSRSFQFSATRLQCGQTVLAENAKTCSKENGGFLP